jgi:hypothetical protein
MDRACNDCEWWQVDFRKKKIGCNQGDSIDFKWEDVIGQRRRVKWYYKYEYTPLETGECRKYRPLLVGTQEDVSTDFQKYAVVVSGKSKTEWPKTTKGQWCGEFRDKD